MPGLTCPAHLDGPNRLACTHDAPHPGYGHRYESTSVLDGKHDDAEVEL